MQSDKVDRRNFIKTIGAGVAGLTVARTPATALGLHEFAAKPDELPELLRRFQPIPITDGHFHMHADLRYPDPVDNLMSVIQACGVQAVSVVSTAALQNRMNENLVTALCKALYPDRVYAFGGLHYHLPVVPQKYIDLGQQARLLVELGFDGFKMLEGKPTIRKQTGYALNDKIYDGYYGFLQETGIPVTFHVADPWEGNVPRAEIQNVYDEAMDVLQKYRGMKITFAHFFFYSHILDRAAELFDMYPSITFDLTPGPAMYSHFSKNPDKTRDFFIKYQDRIVFGTDNHGEPRSFGPGAPLEYWPVYKMIAMRTFLETDAVFRAWHSDLRGIALDAEVLEKIYQKNYQSYAGEKPNHLHVEKVVTECERILDLAEKYAIIHDLLPEVRILIQRLKAV
jgi:predicted TIM-barrel fold metal-dependent hydrolase